jgi:hypothetical protein
MKLSQIASKPQLTKLTIDDEDIVSQFGEPLEFWTWDRQPLDKFMKLASIKDDNPVEIINLVRTMILDEEGKEIISEEVMLPTNVLIRVISVIVETLGK